MSVDEDELLDGIFPPQPPRAVGLLLILNSKQTTQLERQRLGDLLGDWHCDTRDQHLYRDIRLPVESEEELWEFEGCEPV